MYKKLFIVFLTLTSVHSLWSQGDETLFNRFDLSLTGAWGVSTTSIAKFGNEFATFSGGYGGLEFSKNLFVGWGGFSSVGGIFLEQKTNRRIDLRYGGLILAYGFKSHKAVHPKVGFLVGSGNVRLRNEGNDRVFVLQPSGGIELNVFRWFRLGLEGGYRLVNDVDFNSISAGDLSGPYGQLSFKFGWSWGQRY